MKLEIKNLNKQYGKGFLAVKDLSLTLEPGILGLLGPNGAGKSSLMRILATITQPTSGTIHWNGVDITAEPNALRAELGYLPQYFGVYPNLTAVEFLEYMAAIKGIKPAAARTRIDELLEFLNLTDAKNRAIGGYSGGMKQRVGIAQALLNDPKLLILDEPTVGLDPEERVRFRNLLSDLSGQRIVILSTHIVSDIETTATNIALMNKGTLLAHTLPETLLKNIEAYVWELIVPSDQLVALREKYLVTGMIRRSDGIHVRLVSQTPPPNAKQALPTLEDSYLQSITEHRA